MDPTNRIRPQDITSRGGRLDISSRPAPSARPLVTDFAPRPTRPGPLQPTQPPIVASPTPQPRPVSPQPSPVFRQDFVAPVAPRVPAMESTSAAPISPSPEQPVKPVGTPTPAATKPAREKSESGHAGMVGVVVFVVLTALLLSPILPGKIFVDFPLSSQSMSEGDQALACIKPLGTIETTLHYDAKYGFPITYKYATTTTQHATCENTVQTATGGHAGQFNPLGALINVFAAGVTALVIALIWRKLFGYKDY